VKILLPEDDHILCETFMKHLGLEGHSIDRVYHIEVGFGISSTS